MIRIALALAAGILCTILGFRRSSEARERRSRLLRWPALMRRLALLLSEEAGGLPDALRSAACEDGLPDRLLSDMAHQLQTKPLDMLRPWSSSLPVDEAEPLHRMAAQLRQGSRESRVQAAEHCADAFSQLAQAQLSRAEADQKMWRQLGLVGGACLTLWLL